MATEERAETLYVIVEQPLDQVDLQMASSEADAQMHIYEPCQSPVQRIQILDMECDDDPETFLMMFQCAAEDAMLPKEDWPMQLAPLLTGNAREVYQALPLYNANNYDDVKNAILTHVSGESYRKKFRGLAFTAGASLQTVAQQLRDWGRRWLKPETRSAAEMMELILVEQFIRILPESAGEWLSHHKVQSLDSAVQLMERFLTGEHPRPAYRSGHSFVQTSARGKERLATGSAAEEPVIILQLEDVQPDSVTQCGEEKVEDKNTITEFVVMGHEHLRGFDERSKDFQECPENQMVEEEEEFPESDDGVKIERTSPAGLIVTSAGLGIKYVSELESHNIPVERVRGGYTEKMEHQKTILDQATDIFLQCSEQTVIFTKQKMTQKKQIRVKGHQPSTVVDNKAMYSNDKKMQPEGRTCLCSHCGNVYRANASELDRLKNCSGEKKYTCNECEKKLSLSPISSSEQILQQEIKKGNNLFVCGECGKGFNRRLHLSIHHRKHTGEKPFTCCECGKTFNQASNLVRHQQVHSDAKPHVCSQCGKSFKRPSQLTRHQLRHTDREKKYACSICGQRFTQSFNMIAHQRKRICCLPSVIHT
ncbi:zinc finger and SCAN domain-containing protein 30-like isoform X2 [Pleurodeles waltl]|uniref:zinc finger and SCAN domain-containing protein 30-like isoform X2 n=1 Tax=Pleurodeles waltl TaxID=8319 RepID=UPI003709783B